MFLSLCKGLVMMRDHVVDEAYVVEFWETKSGTVVSTDNLNVTSLDSQVQLNLPPFKADMANSKWVGSGVAMITASTDSLSISSEWSIVVFTDG